MNVNSHLHTRSYRLYWTPSFTKGSDSPSVRNSAWHFVNGLRTDVRRPQYGRLNCGVNCMGEGEAAWSAAEDSDYVTLGDGRHNIFITYLP